MQVTGNSPVRNIFSGHHRLWGYLLSLQKFMLEFVFCALSTIVGKNLLPHFAKRVTIITLIVPYSLDGNIRSLQSYIHEGRREKT